MMGELLCFLVWDTSLVSLINDPGKTPAVAGNYFLWQTWRNSLAVSGSSTVSSQVSCCKCVAITSGLSHGHVLVHAHACRHLLLASWVGFLKSLMPQGRKFKLFTSDIAVLQRKMLLASKYKPAPLYNSCP